MSEYASRESILAKKPRAFRDVETPGRGKLRIRSLTERDLQDVQAANTNKNGTLNLEKSKDSRLRAIVASLVDGEGNLLLTNHDIAALREWDVADVTAVWEGIAALSGTDKDSLEQAEKNSETGPDAGSPSS